jgi:hypothetical protein
MKEYGGYLELDKYELPMLHNTALALNCGRNALAYLVEGKGIKEIYLPYLLCKSVKHICSKYGLKISFYRIDYDFTPILTNINPDAWIYVVNFYGQISANYLNSLVEKYPHIIIDNTHDYFSLPITNIDTIYSCRKYFGVSDGAFLYTNTTINRDLPIDESYDRMRYILGRYERPASEFYNSFVMNDKLFEVEPIKQMSKLTYNLLHGINYTAVQERRSANFKILTRLLGDMNLLEIHEENGTFMYPLLLRNGSKVREKLLQQKIYIPILWSNVLDEISDTWIEWDYTSNIIPIPCDQRYVAEDMYYLVDRIKSSLTEDT